MDYRREATTEEVGKLSEEFVDPSLEDFGPLTKQAPQFDGDVYENGIKVVGGGSWQCVAIRSSSLAQKCCLIFMASKATSIRIILTAYM